MFKKIELSMQENHEYRTSTTWKTEFPLDLPARKDSVNKSFLRMGTVCLRRISLPGN